MVKLIRRLSPPLESGERRKLVRTSSWIPVDRKCLCHLLIVLRTICMQHTIGPDHPHHLHTALHWTRPSAPSAHRTSLDQAIRTICTQNLIGPDHPHHLHTAPHWTRPSAPSTHNTHWTRPSTPSARYILVNQTSQTVRPDWVIICDSSFSMECTNQPISSWNNSMPASPVATQSSSREDQGPLSPPRACILVSADYIPAHNAFSLHSVLSQRTARRC